MNTIGDIWSQPNECRRERKNGDMAQLTEEAFRKQLKEGAFAPVYVFYGAESALVLRYAAQLEEKVRPDDFPEFNMHHLDGEASVDTIAETVEMLPMMGERTCVVVSNYDPEGSNASETKKMEQLLGDMPPHCTLIFREASVQMNPKKPGKWKAFLKAAATAGHTVEIPRRTETDLVRYLTAFAQKRGCTMEAGTARYLMNQCGRNWELLQNEMEKLCAWAQDRAITQADIDTVSVTVSETAGYRMANALIGGEYDSAYRQLDQLLFQREEPVLLLGALASAYVDLYRARAAADSGEQVMTLTKVFDYKGLDFKLKNAARDSRRFTLDQLRKCLRVLSEGDAALKSSRTEPRIILEKTMAQLILIAAERR